MSGHDRDEMYILIENKVGGIHFLGDFSISLKLNYPLVFSTNRSSIQQNEHSISPNNNSYTTYIKIYVF